MSHKLKVSEGDWICSNKDCGNINFSRRSNCNKCGQAKDVRSQVIKQTGAEIGKGLASKSKGLFSADDWQCGKCGNINWARRVTCNICNAAKFGAEEARTGLGGGYNERQNVEYIERDESDGEYDEFGRKKKKFREFKLSGSGYNEEEDDDEEENTSKYDLEEEEEEDDDVDLSKYDLSGSDEEQAKNSDKRNLKRQRSRSRSSSGSPKRRRSRSSSSSSSSDSSDSSGSSSSSSSSRSRNASKSRNRRSRSRSPRRKDDAK